MKEAKILITKDGYSLIKAELLLNEKWHEGYFIIDTGSSRNIVSGASNHYLVKTEKINGIKGNESYGEQVFAKIRLLGNTLPFHGLKIDKRIMPKIEYTILGLIGVDFLLKNDCVIDYQRNCLFKGLRTRPSLESSNQHAYIKMDIGLKEYGVPVMPSAIKGQCFFLIADTGSVVNILSRNVGQTIDNHNSSPCTLSIIEGIDGSIEVAESNIKLQLLLQKDDKVINQTFKDNFGMKQSKGNILCLDAAIYAIDGIIGNIFLMRNKWIFDFCNKIMYSMS